MDRLFKLKENHTTVKREIENRLTNETRSGYLTGRRAYANSSYDRASVVHYHKVMKRLAKRFGWSYTKKNS